MTRQLGNFKNNDLAERTILLVEDEPFVREATGNILKNAGFVVLLADGADQAIEVYEHSESVVHLLMTDMVLPGKNGDELSRELKQRSPELAVLITSGYGDVACENESPTTRSYFLAKPYSRRGLLDKIEAILASPRAQAAQAG